MPMSVTIELPDEIAIQYQQGANIARKELGQFLEDRLISLPSFLAHKLPPPLDAMLATLNGLSDKELWQVTQAKLDEAEQQLYDQLLAKNSQGTLLPNEQKTLTKLGDKARLLTLKKSHAFMLLQWRGHTIPSIDEVLKI